MQIFVQIVLPVILVFLLGYVVQRRKRVDLKSISTIVIYTMAPCLVFRTFYTAELNNQYLLMALFALLLFLIQIGLNALYVKLRRYPQSVESGFVLSIGFMNSGNYGAPILLFAYGELAFTFAISLMVLHSIMMNFFGGFYANRSKGGIKAALHAVIKLPTIYAAALALFFQVAGVQIPGSFFSIIEMIGLANIPVVMLVLGMQLAEIQIKKVDWDKVTYGTASRLIISPLIAYGLVSVMPFDPLVQKVLIVTAAMPSAAMAVIYAIQFDTESELVSSITFISTIASIFTVTVLLAVLG